MKKLLVAVALAGSFLVLGSGEARAEGRTVKLPDLVIVGRVQRPLASLEVSKIPPQLTLTELREPLLDRTEAATTRDPF